MQKLNLFPDGKLDVTLQRLCHQLIENHRTFEDVVMIGLQPRGVYLGRRLHAQLSALIEGQEIPYGELDVTFFRDDFRHKGEILEPNRTQINFLMEGKKVILVDDVLYTGRTIRSAMDAMLAYGRPEQVELLVLVDRRHKRELPIEPSYIGIAVDTIETEKVRVQLKESGGKDEVLLVERE